MSYINNITLTESFFNIVNHMSKYFNDINYDMLLALFNYNYIHMHNMIFIIMLHIYHTYVIVFISSVENNAKHYLKNS